MPPVWPTAGGGPRADRRGHPDRRWAGPQPRPHQVSLVNQGSHPTGWEHEYACTSAATVFRRNHRPCVNVSNLEIDEPTLNPALHPLALSPALHPLALNPAALHLCPQGGADGANWTRRLRGFIRRHAELLRHLGNCWGKGNTSTDMHDMSGCMGLSLRDACIMRKSSSQ